MEFDILPFLASETPGAVISNCCQLVHFTIVNKFNSDFLVSKEQSGLKLTMDKLTEDKMNWMYKGLKGHVNPEEYLMGRKVDKTFELIRSESEPQKSHFDVDDNVVPPSLLKAETGPSHSSVTGAAIIPMVTVDVESKLREDPLYQIRKKEIEKRKEFLLNPVKMKKIQNLLKKSLESSDSSDSDTSSDEEERRKRRKKRHAKEKERDKRKRSRSPSPRHGHGHRKERRRSQERSSHSHRSSKTDMKLHSRDTSKESNRDKSSTSRKPEFSYRKSDHKPKTVSRPKMTPEELESKRLAMMKDAIDRDKERKERVQKYKEEDAKEKDESSKEKAALFMKPLLKNKLDRESIESSVRQKVFSSQRSTSSMDTNFARR